MSNNEEKIKMEGGENNEEQAQENSLFSTLMKGTPNLLDLIDPVKVSDSAFSSHKNQSFPTINEATNAPNTEDKAMRNEKIEVEQNGTNNAQIGKTRTEDQGKIVEEINEEEVPALPSLPLELPEPVQEETEAKPLAQESLFFQSKAEEISTLYLKNLNERVNLTDLKYSLNFLFSQYGQVIAIQVSKKNKLRGQAFLTFAKPAEARKAMKSLQGTLFFQKKMVIQLAKTRSLASFIFEGTFHNLSERIHALRKSKVGIKTMLKDAEPEEAKLLMRTASHILSVQNFPEGLSNERFKLLFRQFPGFKSARLLPQKKAGLVEFYDKAQAMIALKKYQGFVMDEEHLLKVSFAQENGQAVQ